MTPVKTVTSDTLDAEWQCAKDALKDEHVFHPFWEHHNNNGHDDWKDQLDRRWRKVNDALHYRDTGCILSELFDRLYVLRNQLVHGGATWKGSVNRPQVRYGARIMAFLVPRFASLMMSESNHRIDWGPPRFPVVRRSRLTPSQIEEA